MCFLSHVMALVTHYLSCWNNMLHFGVCFFFILAFSYLVGWIFLVYVWGFKKDSFTLVVASQSLLSRWVGHLKFVYFLRMVGFYLGRGATWVVGQFVFNVPYLCFGGTWVHVVTEKYLFRLI